MFWQLFEECFRLDGMRSIQHAATSMAFSRVRARATVEAGD
jgi:hypothetical protein